MRKIGLKIWSHNKGYIEDIIKLYELGVYDYIEMLSVPNSYDTHSGDWVKLYKSLKIPFVIHAPHSGCGFNLAKKELFSSNLKLAKESLKYADDLGAEIVIFHPGVDGFFEETIKQMGSFNDKRVVIENKPYVSFDYTDLTCVGATYEEIAAILDQVGCGFCLDIGHAIFASNSLKIDAFDNIKRFLELRPKIFHLSDGDFTGVIDYHKNFGQGSFDINKILEILPKDANISIETPKKIDGNLQEFNADVSYLKDQVNF